MKYAPFLTGLFTVMVLLGISGCAIKTDDTATVPVKKITVILKRSGFPDMTMEFTDGKSTVATPYGGFYTTSDAGSNMTYLHAFDEPLPGIINNFVIIFGGKTAINSALTPDVRMTFNGHTFVTVTTKPISIKVTEYGAVGGVIRGEFSCTIGENPSNEYEATGTFSVIRIADDTII
jgi:hypothetical protein